MQRVLDVFTAAEISALPAKACACYRWRPSALVLFVLHLLFIKRFVLLYVH